MKRLLVISCSLTIAAAMQAQIIHVPGDYPTIQQGINAATPGDTVLVAEGTYYEQINFLGKKPLMVASQFLMDGDTNHISNTIIDGSQITSAAGSVVNFKSGEDTTSILCGFTVKNGSKGTLYFDSFAGFQVRTGGGVFIYHSGAKLIYNQITENHIINGSENPQLVFGGGIGTALDQVDHWVILDHNKIDNNSCTSNSSISGNQIVGGGVLLAYNATITNNVITNNHLFGSSATNSYGGGLVYGPASLSGNYNITGVITNNTINNNESSSTNKIAEAGGALMQACKTVFSANLVENNIVTSSIEGTAGILINGPRKGTSVLGNRFNRNNSSGKGGGLNISYVNFGEDTLIVVGNNYFIENEAKYGGGFYTYGNLVLLQNNVFSGNHAIISGGAVYLANQSTSNLNHLTTMINNSFYGNTGEVHGGAIFSSYGKPLIFNSIFYQDSAYVFKQEIYLNNVSDTVEIAYSDIDFNLIQGGHIIDGGGNISEDPLYKDPTYLIPYNWSPIIDAGVSNFTCSHGYTFDAPAYQINGDARPVGAGYDMGAYDQEAWGMGIQRITNYGLRITNNPNPFTESTTFSYTLKESSQVIIQVFNSFGKMVAEPLKTTQASGDHHVQWNTINLATGMYFYRIQAGSQVGSGKMVKY